MFFVAGPPGAGKSRAFPVAGFGVDFLTLMIAQPHSRRVLCEHHAGIRDEVNILFESFVQDHIERRASCAFETTLRSGITFDQAALARQVGFRLRCVTSGLGILRCISKE